MIKTETAIQGTTPVDSQKAHKLIVSQYNILALYGSIDISKGYGLLYSCLKIVMDKKALALAIEERNVTGCVTCLCAVIH